MTCHVPVDLLRIEPRIWGDLETSQAICFFTSGVIALAALAGHLPVYAAVPLACPLMAYGLLEVEGQPLRRIIPLLVRHRAWCPVMASDLDLTLWQDQVAHEPRHQIQVLLHCLVGRTRDGR